MCPRSPDAVPFSLHQPSESNPTTETEHLGNSRTNNAPLQLEWFAETTVMQNAQWRETIDTIQASGEQLLEAFLQERPIATIAEAISLPLNAIATLEADITFCDNASMEAVNTEYRQKAQATDVLSFPTFETIKQHDMLWLPSLELPNSEGGCDFSLGSILVSLEWAENAIAKAETPAPKALAAFLLERVAHGLLHLSGQHHDTDAAYQEVLRIQHAILRQLGYDALTAQSLG